MKQACKQVKELKQSCAQDVGEIRAINSLQASINSLTEASKQLRLGGSCLHSKGPECVRCLKEHGRLVGKYVGFPDGLDMADFLYQRLLSFGKTDRQTDYIVQELDRISSELSKTDLQLKKAQETLGDLEKEWNKLQKLKRKEPELSEASVVVHEISAIRHQYDLEKADRLSMEKQLSSTESKKETESNAAKQPAAVSRLVLVKVDALRLQFCCVERASMVSTCKAKLRGVGNVSPVVVCATLGRLKQFCQVQAERLTGRSYIMRALAFCKNSEEVLDEQCKVFSLLRDNDELVAVDVVVKPAQAETFKRTYDTLAENWSQVMSWGAEVSVDIHHPGVSNALGSLSGTLDLSGIGLTGPGLALIGESLRFRTGLKSIDLSCNPLRESGALLAIANIVGANPQLEQLKLGHSLGEHTDCTTKEKLLATIETKVATSLTVLDLSKIRFVTFTKHGEKQACHSWLTTTSRMLGKLANTLQSCMSLNKLFLNGIYSSQKNTGLASACSCAKEPELHHALQSVGEAINSLSCLSTLSFCKNVLASEAQALSVLRMFGHPMPALKEVRGNDLNILGEPPQAEPFVINSAKSFESSPISLSLYRCANLPIKLDLTHIEELNLSDCSLDGRQTLALFAALASNNTIKELMFRNNSKAFIGPEQLEVLVRVGSENARLRTLCLGNSAFLENSPEQAEALYRFVSGVVANNSSRLERLEIGGTCSNIHSASALVKLHWLKMLFDKHTGFCSVHFWGAQGIVKEFSELFVQEQIPPLIHVNDTEDVIPGISSKVLAYTFPEGSLLTLLSTSSA